MRKRTISAALLLACSLIPSAQLMAQHWPKQDYIRYVPLEVPRLIRQTAANERYQLYGDLSDPRFRDVARLDGIDDGRHEVLQQIAVRFAPFMVLNTTAVPMDVRAVASGKESYPLYVDTWNIAAPGSTLLKEETIEFWSVASEPCTEIERAVGNSRKDDCRLLELLDEFHPERPANTADRMAARQAGSEPFKVIYADMPGYDPKSWTEEFEDRLTNRLPERYQRFLKTYVHPFLLEVDGPDGVGLELVLQYWFFYPWNDGGNNHEGDWEHINVVVSPLHAVQRNLTPDDMGRLLDGEWLGARTGDEQLVIKRLEYYFHGKVLTLDYTAPNVYLPREEWKRAVDERVKQVAGEDWFWRMIRRRAYEDDEETRINTHPVVHIGADNKGTDQVLAMPGGTNRDSHGSFPFPALYKDVGPAGAAENIETFFNHRDYFAASPEEKAQLLSKWKRGGVVFLADTSHVYIVPDYERVIDLIETDVRARQEWSWLVLPMRWGYPAVASPFAGVVPNAETGNLAVVGPAFNSGWNQSGATAGYATYEPHRIPRLFPLGWVDNFQNSWGFLNLTLPTIAFLPPIDLVWRFVAAPIRAVVGRQDPTFYPQDRIPFRFFGFTSGVSWMDIPTDYTDLLYNEVQFNQIIGRLLGYVLANGSENTVATSDGDFAKNATAAFYQSSFFVGDRFASQSMLRHSRTDLGSTLEFSDIPDPFEVRGELNFWEFAGSLRYNLFTGGLVPYAKAGYGWSWYRIENITTNGEPLDDPDLDWIRKPSIFPFENLLPNTWHVGAGLEFIVIKTFGVPPRGWDLSVRGEWTMYTNDLGLEISNLPLETLVLLGTTADDLPRERWITRNEFKLGATIGF